MPYQPSHLQSVHFRKVSVQYCAFDVIDCAIQVDQTFSTRHSIQSNSNEHMKVNMSYLHDFVAIFTINIRAAKFLCYYDNYE